jgi:hypothetical protein
MKTNVGAFDGYLRSLIFIITVVVAVLTGQWVWVIPGAILFATAVLMWCPIYAMIGFNDNTDPS